jgi:diketogulonate reductase-like aldo/keto reductase
LLIIKDHKTLENLNVKKAIMNTPSDISRRKMISLSLAAGAGLFLPKLTGQTISNLENIIMRAIPSSGEKIPVIGMGTWQTFVGGNDQTARIPLRKVLKAFVELGGRVIDSSPMYGTSEQVVGDLATELGVTDQLFMATKVWTNGKEEGIQQMKNSIRKMQKPQMDLMQVHNLLDLKTHIKTLRKWKEEGAIRYIGITHYTVSSHDELTRLIETEPLDFVQLNYSIETRNAENRLLPAAQDNGVAVLVNRPFEGGNLFRKTKGQALPEWATEIGIKSWGQFFLKYILSHPAVSCVIPATSKEHHMRDNMMAGYGELPDTETRQKMISLLT